MAAEYEREPHKIIAYAFEEPVHMERFFQCAIAWLESLGLSVSHMYSNYNRNCMTLSFKKAYAKIKKSGFGGIDTLSLTSGPKRLPNVDQGYYARVRVCNCISTRDFTLNIQDRLLNAAAFDAACLEFAQLCRADWGFRKVVDRCPYTIEVGGPGFVSDMYYTGGFIDRVYAWTLLNQYHLDRLVGKPKFADWVAASASRGCLEPYFAGRWIWKVPSERIGGISQTLCEMEIIPDIEKHYRAWTGAFSNRFMRGDIDGPTFFRLLMAQVRRDGRPPTPPRHQQVGIVNNVAVWDTDEAAVTRYLKHWGHPAGDLPEPPPAAPMPSAQVVKRIQDALGGAAPPEMTFVPGTGHEPTNVQHMKALVKADAASPIGDPENLDILNVPQDGLVDVLILVQRPLDVAKKTTRALEQKFRNYCRYIKSKAFRDEFGRPDDIHVRVGLLSDWEIPAELIELVETIAADEHVPAEVAIFYEYPA
jgi:hypothetical protein